MLTSIKNGYQSALEHNEKLLQHSLRLSKLVSLLRLATFIFAAILALVFAKNGSPAGVTISLFAGIAIFILLIRIHSKILTDKKFLESKIKINRNELDTLDGKFSCFENGMEFIDPGHPFTLDLDIFGEGSLFQMLNRTSTNTGRDNLAFKLKKLCLEPEIIKRNQDAIAELKEKMDWRQDFQATGMVYEDKKSDKERILNWLQLPALFNHFIFLLLLVIIPVLTIMMILFTFLGIISGMQFIFYLAIPLGISGAFAIRINRRHFQVSKTSEMLTKFALLVKKIETLTVISPRLAELKHKVKSDACSASKSLKSLSSILTALDNRLNFVSWTIFNGLLLWDILQMKRLENWQKLHRQEVANWFETIAEFDVLVCFANFCYNNPQFCFPEIVTYENIIKAEGLGHPMIPGKLRVDNPADIKKGQFLIITGANMAGKSTYLRTVGVNLVLATCGAPVCATSFRFKPVDLYTSIHTADSLHKNESYFYSELKRLKAIIEELKRGVELFIILDEILKGTNSRDKHAGSEALLRQLVQFKTAGIVATHDVSLGSLQDTFPEHICNRCFEVDIENDRLAFDYRLREGVSKNMNATLLMREMGITV
jgi:ABC-type multidrug transport system fused ATPase/permease subunit